MSKALFSIHAEDILNKEADRRRKKGLSCRRRTKAQLVGCLLCAGCAQEAFPGKNYVTSDGRITTEFSEEARESIKKRLGINDTQARRMLRQFDALEKEIAHECRDYKIEIRMDVLCLAFPRNYLDYTAAIGKNLGLFYRCTGRKYDEELDEIIQTFS